MTKKMHDSHKRIAFPIRLFDESSVAIPSEIHVCPVGKWDHYAYGEIEITTDSIAEFVSNFKRNVRRDIPITAGHDNGMNGGELPAIGWFKELIDRGVKGLFALVEWTDEGKELLKNKAYKYFSPELYFEYRDTETQETFKNVLVGGALTNKPYFKELEPVIAFSEPSIINQLNFNENLTMDLKTLIAKDITTLTDEEKAFIVEHKDELSDEEKETLKDVIAPVSDDAGNGSDDKSDADTNDGADDGAGDGAGAGEGGDDAKDEHKNDEEPKADADEQPVPATMAEMSAELLVLRKKADDGEKAFAELTKMRLGEQVSKMVFSESNKDGHILPKQKDAVVSFMLTLSEKQRDQFSNIINNLPKNNIFGEVGKDDGEPADVKKRIDVLVEKTKKDKNVKFSEALRIVLRENPDLAKEYADTLLTKSE